MMKLTWRTAGMIALVSVGTLVVLDVMARRGFSPVAKVSDAINQAIPSGNGTGTATTPV